MENKIPGKKTKPTRKELEFVYERLNRLSDEKISEEMQNSKFPEPSKSYFDRRRIEFEAAKIVIAKIDEGAYIKDSNERRKRHWNRLSDIADKLALKLRDFWPYDKNITVMNAVISEDNLEFAELISNIRAKWLLSHLQTELPELKNINEWGNLKINEITDQLIDLLYRKVETNKFYGKCDGCRGFKK